jgi:deoxyadenosine/deoxycytidine kinase
MYLKIPKENNSKFIVIMGEVSAGKTSIYNWLFNKKLPTGAGEVTQ